MKRLAIGLAVITVSGTVPAIAGATSVGQGNGQLAFTSGRAPANNDNEARIWVVGPNGGTATQVTFTAAATGQHRQPNWSPDHTKIAYSISPSGAIRIKDLVANTDTPFVAAVAGQDRPTWSPDGTKIAYGSGGKIWVKAFPLGPAAVQVTSPPAGQADERPVWTPDGSALFFNREVSAGNNDIYRVSPVSIAATPVAWVSDATKNDWQTNVSPNGAQICFTRGPKNNTAELRTASATTPNLISVNPFSSAPSINCVYSPDGTEIAYTAGTFNNGQLVAKPSTGGGVRTISADATPSVYFDGNADWATNFSPTCQGGSVNVPVNGFVSIVVTCTDTESGAVDAEIATNPTQGNLGAIDDSTNTVIYTPNANFSGTDSFTFTGNDQESDSDPATVTVNVGDPGGGGAGGKDATAARIDRVGLSRRTWRRGRSLPSLSRAAAAVGTTISFRLSERARVTLTFSRKARGRKVGRRCVKPTRRNRTRPRCTRYVKAGTLRIDGKAGVNRVKFQGRLSRRKRLALGRYRLTVGATDGAGNKSRTSRPVAFRIVRR